VDIETIRTAVEQWPDRALALRVVDQASYDQAGALLREIKGLRAEIEQTFSPIVSKALAAHREALAQRKRHEAPLVAAELEIKMACARYVTEQEQLARLERERQEADARRAAAEQAAAARAAEEEARLAHAVELEAAGLDADAAAVLEEPMPVPVVLPPPSLPKAPPPRTAGVTVRERWTWELLDLQALVAAVAAGRAPVSLLQPNPSALTSYARSTRGTVTVDGVRIYAVADVAARAAGDKEVGG
jgi:hypothetical protein